MEIMGLDIERINHACFRVKGSKTLYFDAFKVKDGDKKADLVFVGHEHYDHCSRPDIEKVSGKNTVLIVNSNSLSKVSGMEVADVKTMSPGDSIEVNGVRIIAVAAYNTNKFRAPGQPFHPKQDEHCGYVVKMDGVKIYHTGDTDNIPEMEKVECDICMIPVSGTYVMTTEEASQAVKRIKPKVAIPMHYGDIVGSMEDAEKFQALANCKVQIL